MFTVSPFRWLRTRFGSLSPSAEPEVPRSSSGIATSSTQEQLPDFNLFILGCGRSGTSLAAGLFRNCGFFMGDELYPPRQSNPKGFFEDPAVNGVNEELLSRSLPNRGISITNPYGYDIPETGHRWLARLPINHTIEANAAEITKITALTARTPFCFKDPRFCYTLDVWRKLSERSKFICVFRNPAAFVGSVFQECLAASYLHDFAVSVSQMYEVWESMYSHVLERHSLSGDWLFIEYDHLLTSAGIDAVSHFTGLSVDASFPDASLNRTHGYLSIPRTTMIIYDRLRAKGVQAGGYSTRAPATI